MRIKKTPRYFVVHDEGKSFFPNGKALLKFLRKNDISEVGCEYLTAKQWKKIKNAKSDRFVQYKK